MVSKNQIKGHAFEHWVRDALGKYAENVSLTKHQAHFDVTFDYDGKHYLLECKIVSYFTSHRSKMYPNAVCFQKTQLKHLIEVSNSMISDNEVFAIIGIMFNDYDIYPVACPIIDIKKFGANGDKMGRTFVSISKVLRFQPFRNWVGNTFDIEPINVWFPEYRTAVDSEIRGVDNENNKNKE